MSQVSSLEQNKKQMPADQATIYVLHKAIIAYRLIREFEKEWEQEKEISGDVANIREHQAILVDALTVYLASLADHRRKTHSLKRSYKINPNIEKLLNDPLVLSCIKHRHERAAHQSIYYGGVVSLDDILKSDLDETLKVFMFTVRNFEKI